MKKINVTRRTAMALNVVVAMSMLAGTAAADQLADITAAKKIRVGIDLAVPPFGMKDAKLNSVGSDVETAQLLAKTWGLELELVPVSGATRIPVLLTDKADIVISSFSITPERAKVIDFSTPYAAVLAVVGASRGTIIKTASDLVGKRVAVGRGSTNETELNKIALPGTQIIRFEDEATSITAFVSGQADAIATAPPLINRINQMTPAKDVETKIVMQANMIGIGLRKNEPGLKAKLDAFVKSHLKNDLGRIYKKYHGDDLPIEVTVGAN